MKFSSLLTVEFSHFMVIWTSEVLVHMSFHSHLRLFGLRRCWYIWVFIHIYGYLDFGGVGTYEFSFTFMVIWTSEVLVHMIFHSHFMVIWTSEVLVHMIFHSHFMVIWTSEVLVHMIFQHCNDIWISYIHWGWIPQLCSWYWDSFVLLLFFDNLCVNQSRF